MGDLPMRAFPSRVPLLTLGLLWVAAVHANPTVVKTDKVPALINAGHFDIIVDIRSAWEYARGHIKGAINLPLDSAIEKLRGWEAVKIAVHCFRGYDRARPFAVKFANSGYKQVHDIGGFRDIQDHVATGTGAWNGVLPSCATKKTSVLHKWKSPPTGGFSFRFRCRHCR